MRCLNMRLHMRCQAGGWEAHAHPARRFPTSHACCCLACRLAACDRRRPPPAGAPLGQGATAGGAAGRRRRGRRRGAAGGAGPWLPPTAHQPDNQSHRRHRCAPPLCSFIHTKHAGQPSPLSPVSAVASCLPAPNLPRPACPPADGAVCEVLQRCGELRALALRGLLFNADATAATVAASCRHLTSLDLRHCSTLSGEGR